MINVTVAYALPEKQWVKTLQVVSGSTVQDVLNECEKIPELRTMLGAIDLSEPKVGVFGFEVQRDQVVKEGDRVEIYRPLIRDPKAARRLRAQKKNQNK